MMRNKTYTLLSYDDIASIISDLGYSNIFDYIQTNCYYKAWLITSPSADLNPDIKGLQDAFYLTIVRHKNDYCTRYETPNITATPAEILALKSRAVFEFINALTNVMNFTYEKYSKILDVFDVTKTELLKGIMRTTSGSSSGSNSGKSVFNDTPQNENTGGVYSGDNYATTITSNSGSSNASASETSYDDSELLIDRLEKIGNKYESIILRWSNEFNKLFIMEVNYER
ncbi:MAG: hypothetical protein J6T10_13450 [Methanobrevibacter sp.]|nr:hypothetical protein [Methanobrevibacter sp.]